MENLDKHSGPLLASLIPTFPLEKDIQGKKYLIDLTKDPDIIDQAFQLRYKVFNLELGEGLKESYKTQRDTDQYDPFCDHLVVIDQSCKQVVGTYRIMRYENAVKHVGFYSETEFNLDNIYKHLPHAAEIGRCCVHPEYRGGLVMNLLWYGLANYMLKFQVTHLFGCASLNKGDTHQQASILYKICESCDAIINKDLTVSPQPGFEVKFFNKYAELPKIAGNPKRLLPSLLRGYVSIGVKICGAPAFDPEFGVIDFFTMFDYEGIAKAAKRFFPK